MSAVTLHRIDDARNMRRFFRLDVQPDLFGGFAADSPRVGLTRADCRSARRLSGEWRIKAQAG